MSKYLSICLLQLTINYTTSLSRTPFYWKTSTDNSVDYWNHGPIFVPGLQIYSSTNKNNKLPWITPDTTRKGFPPWLTRTNHAKAYWVNNTPTTKLTTSTEKPTKTEDSTIEATNRITVVTTKPTRAASKTTRNLVVFRISDTTLRSGSEDKAPVYDNIEVKEPLKRLVKSTTVSSANSVHIDEVFRHSGTTGSGSNEAPVYYDNIEVKPLKKLVKSTVSSTKTHIDEGMPFSTFLRRLLQTVCGKGLPELFKLMHSFLGYVSLLTSNGKLSKLGSATTSFITKSVQYIRDLGPEELRKNCDTAHLTLQQHQLPKLSDLLHRLDDVFDEAEEESMQQVLDFVAKYPDARSSQDIAKHFVDEVFLNPIHRVDKTPTGNYLFKIIEEAIYMPSIRTNRKRQVGESDFRLRSGHVNKTKRSYNELNFLIPMKKRYRGHRHKHRHGYSHTHRIKRRYKKLKHKYRKLLEMIKSETKAVFEKTSSKVTDPTSYTPLEANVTISGNGNIQTTTDNQIEEYDDPLNTTPEKENINDFMGQYDYGEDFKFRRNWFDNSAELQKIHRTENNKLNTIIDDEVIYYRKAYERLHPSPIYRSNITDETDLEIELKENLYDALRHVDFVNTTARRNMYHGIPEYKLGNGSIETEAEASMKNKT